MKYSFFFNLKTVLLFAFASLQMVSMELEDERQPTEFLFAAIRYYEQGKYEKAATIFQRYAGKPVPIAESFCRDLVKKNYLPPFEGVMPKIEGVSHSNMYFEGAQQFLSVKKKVENLKKQGSRKVKKALQSCDPLLQGCLQKAATNPNGALLYVIGTLYETKKTGNKVENISHAKKFFEAALQKGDLRAALGLKRVCLAETFKQLKVGNLPLATIFSAFSLMPVLHQDEGQICARLSGFFSTISEEKSESFLYSAAEFGHPEAQFIWGQSYCENESQTLYWMMLAAEHGDHGYLVEALSMCGHMLEQGKGAHVDYEKAYPYLQQAAHHSNARDVDFFNFALFHEQGRGTPIDYPMACNWYAKAYQANPYDPQNIYRYGNLLARVGKFKEALPLLKETQGLSSDAAYDYAVALKKLAPEGDDLTEVVTVWSQLAAEGYLNAACSLVDLVVEGKIFSDSPALATYKTYLEQAMATAILKKGIKNQNEGISAAYMALRNLYITDKEAFAKESVHIIDFSEKSFRFNPQNQRAEFAYAQDLKEAGRCQEALELFLSLQQKGSLFSLNSLGSCYDALAKRSQRPEEADQLAKKALACYRQEVENIQSPYRAIAAFNIYCLYLQERVSLPCSQEELVNFLEIAAEGGDEEALNDLGAAYMDGSYGLAPDWAKAEQLFRQSIHQGCPTAKINLMNLKSMQPSLEANAEKKGLWNELWRDNPTEFEKYLTNTVNLLRHFFRQQEQETPGEEDYSHEIKEEQDQSGDQELIETETASLAPSSGEEKKEESAEEDWKQWADWKKWDGQTAPLPKQEESQPPAFGLSNREDQEQAEQDRLHRKYGRLMARVEALRTRKQAKFRKIKTLIGQHINAFGGAVKNAKGSGRRLQLGDVHEGFHQPHGRNGSEVKGGVLESLTTLLQGQTTP